MNRTTRAVLLPALALAGVIAVAGCGGNSGGGHPHSSASSSAMGSMPGMDSASPSMGPAATGPHNQADVDFATAMIPHHGQAVTMADLALSKATNSQVKQLATSIKKAQNPEIVAMSGWLADWKQPVPDPTSTAGSMPGMNMGSGQGMMSAEDMTKLDNASGAAFDKLWLQMMISHHQGAVDMAKTEQAKGQNPDAKKLAGSIITSQTSEIITMKTLLTSLGG
jgi:uncharacterized protein (DUF305 family)